MDFMSVSAALDTTDRRRHLNEKTALLPSVPFIGN